MRCAITKKLNGIFFDVHFLSDCSTQFIIRLTMTNILRGQCLRQGAVIVYFQAWFIQFTIIEESVIIYSVFHLLIPFNFFKRAFGFHHLQVNIHSICSKLSKGILDGIILSYDILDWKGDLREFRSTTSEETKDACGSSGYYMVRWFVYIINSSVVRHGLSS